jgi:crotonobetainyl-CoA:carnitine CoA-transferase CaiB-like acyl-CoA transferase
VGPLTGYTVVDLTSTFMGPYGTLQLVDLGAEVLKIEPPTGDITRHLGATRGDGLSSVFVAANRGKRSVVLDLKSERGHADMLRLLAAADVFVHNLRPDALERLRLRDVDVCPHNPQLIHCSATGFGTDGPYAGRPAYDDIVQAASGFAALQGRDSEPTYVASVIADKTVGLLLANAVLAAVLHRERTGEGQALEVPMFESMVSFLLVEQLGGLTFDPPLGPSGYSRTATPHRRPYPTQDGYLAVVVYTSRHWERFLAHVGRSELLQDPRYATPASRSEHIDDLYAIVGEELARDTSASWLEVLDELDIPATQVREVDELLDDPHLRDVDLFRFVEHPGGDALRVVRPTVRYGSYRPGLAPAPLLGADTDAVLARLGGRSDAVGATSVAEEP